MLCLPSPVDRLPGSHTPRLRLSQPKLQCKDIQYDASSCYTNSTIQQSSILLLLLHHTQHGIVSRGRRGRHPLRKSNRWAFQHARRNPKQQRGGLRFPRRSMQHTQHLLLICTSVIRSLDTDARTATVLSGLLLRHIHLSRKSFHQNTCKPRQQPRARETLFLLRNSRYETIRLLTATTTTTRQK